MKLHKRIKNQQIINLAPQMEQNENDSKSNGGAIQENCPVCLENPATKKTKCEHKFCSPCLDAWSAANNSCPLCRSELVSAAPPARTNDNDFIYTIPWSVYPEDPTYMPRSNYSRIDTIPDFDLRFHQDSFVEEPFTNAQVFNTNNVSVVIPRWPAEFRGIPYVSLEFPSISDTD